MLNFNFLVVLKCDQDAHRSLVFRHSIPVSTLPYALSPIGYTLDEAFNAKVTKALDEQVIRLGMLLGEKRFRGMTYSTIHSFVQDSLVDTKVKLKSTCGFAVF